MLRIISSLAGRLHSDRGEFGPMAYAVMVSALVLLGVAVAAWGSDIANLFMGQVDDVTPD